MKNLIFCFLFFFTITLFARQNVKLVSTTELETWKVKQILNSKISANNEVVIIDRSNVLQSMDGFGACFNELGWVALKKLNSIDREKIMKDLFLPRIGANFTLCRMPVGANDFSRDWYSYNEMEGDFSMSNFSVQNDLETLIPFIKEAKQYNPKLKIWASPWSPPSWMKWNKHYACASSKNNLKVVYRNGLSVDMQGKEGANMFIQDDKYMEAYALYFSKFITEYRTHGINISMVMPQNEFNSCQVFPSCIWTATSLAKFIGEYLGPSMKKLKVDVMFGTMERPTEALIDTILADQKSAKYIKGIGFQWAGKDAITGIHKRYPALKLFQTEQECGDGKNDWKSCKHSWDLMKHYISNGASAYMYWNLALEEGGVSRWGWSQNSLITVLEDGKSYKYNYEYYLLKHLSHFVMQGAKLLKIVGCNSNLLVFENPDKSIIILIQNISQMTKSFTFKVGKNQIAVDLEPDSFNTIVIQ